MGADAGDRQLGERVVDQLVDAGSPPPRPTEATPRQLRFTPRPAVRWFHPQVLLAAGLHEGLTSVFGSFLDKRELQVNEPAHVDTRVADQDQVWLDYLADTGDGFDATYAVAAAAAARRLTVDGCPEPLPRGRFLVLGGDQVYPAATAEDYEDRLEGPLRAALPWTEKDHPGLFAIPGNHDWYDGLTGFLRLFGQGRWIGGRRTSQVRSYFAVQLPHRWWLWGIDIQFDMYIDAPQLAFFDGVLDRMRRGDRLVLATAVPTWVELAGDPDAYRNLAYVERKLLRPRGIELKLTLAGDRHHYSRFTDVTEAPATGPSSTDGGEIGPAHKITSGGGGAFLHTTHDLPAEVTIRVDPDITDDTATFRAETLYPDARRSRRLALGALLLPVRNPAFTWIPGIVHLVLLWTNQFGIRSLAATDATYATSGARSGWRDLALGLVRNPVSLALLGVLWGGLLLFARPPTRLSGWTRALVRLGMATAHTAAQVAAVVAVSLVAFRLASVVDGGLAYVLVASAVVTVLGGAAGAFVVGAYLTAASLAPRYPTHTNEASSAARIERCKNFLRLHVRPDGALDVYAIGIDRPPVRWRPDPAQDDPEAPWLVPDGSPCTPHLIERTTIR